MRILVLGWVPGFRFPGFQGSRFPGFQVSSFPGFQFSRFPGFQVSRVLGFQGSRFSGLQVSRFPDFQVSIGFSFPGYRFPGFQGSRVPRFQDSRGLGLIGFPVSKVPGLSWQEQKTFLSLCSPTSRVNLSSLANICRFCLLSSSSGAQTIYITLFVWERKGSRRLKERLNRFDEHISWCS